MRSLGESEGAMISDEERREVAARLRGLDVKITSRDTLERAVDKFMKAVCGDIPFSPIRYSVRNLCGLANMLADLIEPRHETTEDVSDDYGKFECGKCGCRIDDVTAVDNGGINFCPDCGKEIEE